VISTYTGGQWVRQDMTWTASEQQCLIDENFNFNIGKRNTIRWSDDDGATWNTMTGGTSNGYNRNDIRYFKMTGKIRDTHADIAGGNVSECRYVEFTTPAWSQYTDSQGVNNIRPCLQGGGQITGNVGAALASADEEGTNVPLGENYQTFSGGTLNLQESGAYTFTPATTGVPDRGVTDVINLVAA
jgi:hypothetical protein